ncbi:hypothetical protein V6N13_120353 [Hibiscus sabdariffa]|uniref:Phytocyanin domain-containing protein n=1 Tax=Hibiscus sabdariffa TaxID=183260 RepID=A0ABR2E432_9ROSI
MASSGSNTAQQSLLLGAIAASLLAYTQAATVVVGGTDNWRYVFKYGNTPPHSLQNMGSYLTCDFSKAKLLANPKSLGHWSSAQI